MLKSWCLFRSSLLIKVTPGAYPAIKNSVEFGIPIFLYSNGPKGIIRQDIDFRLCLRNFQKEICIQLIWLTFLISFLFYSSTILMFIHRIHYCHCFVFHLQVGDMLIHLHQMVVWSVWILLIASNFISAMYIHHIDIAIIYFFCFFDISWTVAKRWENKT